MEITKKFYGGVCLGEKELKENEIEHNIEVEYYSIQNNNKYGIEVIKREYKPGNTIVEKESIEDFTEDERVTNEIINLLKKNKVTPVTLQDVVIDLMKTV